MKKAAAFLTAVWLLAVCAVGAAAAGKTFPDVQPGQWFYGDVTEMAGHDVLKGYGDGTFRPNGTVTAGEFVTIVVRQAGVSQSPGRVDHWSAGYMQAALERGWYDWDECPPTDPANYDKPISRQVAVKVLMKALLPEVRGDYNTVKSKMKDFADLDGRYYEAVFAAYEVRVARGDKAGTFRPKAGLSRAEACALVRRAAQLAGTEAPPQEEPTEPPAPTETRKGGVSENGWLRVEGTQLCSESGQPVVLHGMSSHGLQWYGQFASEGAVKATGDRGANLFRAAMYTGENGYLSQPAAMEKKVTEAVNAAVRNDMYVIIDWHILSDGNPGTNQAKAQAFFEKMAKRYRDNPAVIFEICNEPNGGVSWAGDVKPYAQAIVDTIRNAGAQNIILIGSPTWSQDVHLAAADPVKGTNLMYTLHFYAGTHGKDLRDRADAALKKGLPLFVSEWGTSRADGSGGVFLKEAGEWLDFLDRRGISWANWSLCDKGETSAALKPGASPSGGWKDSDLTDSGRFVFSRF